MRVVILYLYVFSVILWHDKRIQIVFEAILLTRLFAARSNSEKTKSNEKRKVTRSPMDTMVTMVIHFPYRFRNYGNHRTRRPFDLFVVFKKKR